MKRILWAAGLLGATALLFFVTAQPAQTQTVVGSSHDLGSGGTSTFTATNTDRVCVFCHTPHQAATAGSQEPLWNHTLSATVAYGVYTSATLNATPTEIGGATPGTASVSNLCMSCHDGTVGVGSLYNDPNNPAAAGEIIPDNSATTITTNANMGTSLVDDHPVNFTYDGALATVDGGLVTPVSVNFVDAGSTVPLFNATVQCASCHNVHDPTNDFLVISNSGSALCITCHTQ